MLRSFEDSFLIPEASFPIICLLDGPRPQHRFSYWASPPSILPLGGLRPLVPTRRASSSAINSCRFTPPMFYHLGGARPLVSIFDPWRFVSCRLQLLIAAEHHVSCPVSWRPALFNFLKENVSFVNACMHVCMCAKWFIVSCPFFGLLRSWCFPAEVSSCPLSMLSLRIFQSSIVLSHSFPNSFYNVMTLRIFSKVFSFKIPSLFLVWALPKSEIQFQQEFHLSNVFSCVCDSFTKNCVQLGLVYTSTTCILVFDIRFILSLPLPQ